MWPEGLGEDGANIAQERSGLSSPTVPLPGPLMAVGKGLT